MKVLARGDIGILPLDLEDSRNVYATIITSRPGDYWPGTPKFALAMFMVLTPDQKMRVLKEIGFEVKLDSGPISPKP